MFDGTIFRCVSVTVVSFGQICDIMFGVHHKFENGCVFGEKENVYNTTILVIIVKISF